MEAIYVKRLLKLAAHLEIMPRKRFDFSNWIGGATEKLPCGTTACAVGECPKVFPKHWKYAVTKTIRDIHTQDGYRMVTELDITPSLRNGLKAHSQQSQPLLSAREFFGLTFDESFVLFTPVDPMEEAAFEAEGIDLGAPRLPETATPKQVAKHIRRFVKQKEKANV